MKRIEKITKILSDLSLNNSEIKHYPRKSKNFKNHDGRVINFDLFVEKDLRRKRDYFHIVFNGNTNAIETAKYLSKNHNDIFKLDTYIYILRKKGVSTEIIQKIESELPKREAVISVEFMSDIIKQISEHKSDIKFKRVNYTLPKAFINPTILEKKIIENSEEIKIENKPATNYYIQEWIENTDKPILLILGKGGVGKTTIAEYFSNLIIEQNTNTSSVFIDSIEIKTKLKNDTDQLFSLSLYDLYKASQRDQNIIDEYYFGSNLDHHNFFLIIDGVDELMSKVKTFEIKPFIDSIKDYNKDIKGCKIIITCRTEYWNIKDNSIQEIELQPFDKIQMENFFLKNFENDPKKRQKSNALADIFHLNKEPNNIDNIYHPYALDLIVGIVGQTEDETDLGENLETIRLNTKIDTDYIIAKICFRESHHSGKPRVLDLSIDEQVKILEYLAAVINDTTISLDRLEEAVLFGINKNLEIDQEVDHANIAKSFRSHPLLKFNDENKTISFAFDFYSDVFKSTNLAYILNNDTNFEEVTNEVLEIISNFKFESQLIKDISNRMREWEVEQKISVEQLIQIISKTNLSITEKENLYSGIFNLSFQINSKFSKSKCQDKITNSELIEDVFMKNNQINNLCLVNIEEKIHFDFSRVLKFENCVFHGYSSFWSNKNDWNSNVRFVNCKFKELGEKSSNKEINWVIDNKYTNFDFNSQKNMDDEFKKQFIKIEDHEKELKSDIEKLVKQFIRFFWKSNVFYAQNYERRDDVCRSPLLTAFNKFSKLDVEIGDFIEKCDSIDFIKWSRYNKNTKKINLHPKFHSEFKKYIQTNDKPKIVKKLEESIYRLRR